MKKILLYISFILCSVVAMGQFPITQSQGSPSTQVYSKGAYGSDSGFVYRTNYSDTTTANLGFLDAIPGIAIRVGNRIFIRNQAATQWVGQATTQDIVAVTGCYTLLNGGIVTWSGSGYTMDVSKASYIIGCNLYSSPTSQVTLAASDPTLDRIDVIAVNTSGVVVAITGTPGATPVKPQVDITTQLELTFITVEAGSTTPGGVSTLIVYDEGTEWDTTSSLGGGSVNFNSTSNPFHLIKSALTTNATEGNLYWDTTDYVNTTDFTTLKLYVRQTASFSAASFGYGVYLRKDALAVTNTVDIVDYGFDITVYGSYQVVTIPIGDFIYSGGGTPGDFDGVAFKISNGAPIVNVDYVQLQGGIPTGSSPYITDVFRRAGTDSVFQVKNGVAVFAFKDSTGGGGATPTWQQTLTAGSTLTTNNSINVNTNSLTFNNGSGYTFNWNQGGNSSYLTGSTNYFEALVENGSVGGSINTTASAIQLLKYRSGGRSDILINSDSITVKPHLGQLNIDSLRSWSAVADTTHKKPMTWDTRNGRWEYASNWFSSGGGGSTSLSALTAATGSNTINNANNPQVWQWNTLSDNAGLTLYSNSTAAASSSQSILTIGMEGANSNSGQTTTGLAISNTHTGTSSVNRGLVVEALNGTTNRAIESTGGVRHTSLGTASTDTTTYKPVGINSSGDIIPMSNWSAGSGANGIYTLQRDTITLASFVAGARFVADTAAFTDSTLYGAFYNDGSDTLVITGLRGVMNGGTSDTLRVQVYYNDSLNVIGSSLLTNPHPLNSTTVGNAADADDFIDGTIVKIPPGNWVWMKSPTVVAGRKPWFLSVSLFGYKARR